MTKVYVHATLKIRIGGYERFCEAMAQQLPVLEGYGWKLLGAWTTAVGRVCTVIDLWELEDANAFFEVTAKWRAGPEFQAFRARFDHVTAESLLVCLSGSGSIAHRQGDNCDLGRRPGRCHALGHSVTPLMCGSAASSATRPVPPVRWEAMRPAAVAAYSRGGQTPYRAGSV